MDSNLTNRKLGKLVVFGIITTLFSSVMLLESNKSYSVGYMTQQNATANVNISPTLSIRLLSSAITFGSGTVNNGYNYCWIAKDGDDSGYIDFYDNFSDYSNQNCTSSNPFSANGEIKLENVGNVYANITVKSSKNASTFLGGSSPDLRFGYDDDYDSYCLGNHAKGLADINNISELSQLNTNKNNFCEKLNFSDGSDKASLQFILKIPSDAAGYKENTIIFEASTSN